ncbi:MAG: hypothetical protein M1827_006650 [Pycnora praestabilis]|nr:MAG: hypothetical protein M1827_006650 [Pycnora praestabilis]
MTSLAEGSDRDPSELSFARAVDAILHRGHSRPSASLHAFVDDEEETPEQRVFLEPQYPIEVLTAASWPPVAYARDLVQNFNELVSASVFILGEAETEGLLQSVYNSGGRAAPRTSVCQLCMIFALVTQVTNPERSASTFWFENGRRYLDELLNDIGEGNLWTARVFIMICLFYIRHKRTAAHIYLELAIRAAKHHQGALQGDEHSRLYYTLVMVDRYLSPMLGKPFIILDSEASVHMQLLMETSPGNLALRDCIALLSFIGGRLLDRVYSASVALPSDPAVYEACAGELERCLEKFTPALQDLIRTASTRLPPFNIEIYRVQILYHSTSIAMYRPALEQCVLQIPTFHDSHHLSISPAVAYFANICINAAWDVLQMCFSYDQQGVPYGLFGVSVSVIFQAFLVMTLAAIRQTFSGEGSYAETIHQHPGSPITGIDMAVTLLERHAVTSDTAKLYAKVSRSMRRLLQNFLASGDQDKGKGRGTPSGSYAEALNQGNQEIQSGSGFSSVPSMDQPRSYPYFEEYQAHEPINPDAGTHTGMSGFAQIPSYNEGSTLQPFISESFGLHSGPSLASTVHWQESRVPLHQSIKLVTQSSTTFLQAQRPGPGHQPTDPQAREDSELPNRPPRRK